MLANVAVVRRYIRTKPTNLSSSRRQEIDKVILGQIILCSVPYVLAMSLSVCVYPSWHLSCELLLAGRFVLRVQTASETVVSFPSARFSQRMVLNNNDSDSFKTFKYIQLSSDMGELDKSLSHVRGVWFAEQFTALDSETSPLSLGSCLLSWLVREGVRD